MKIANMNMANFGESGYEKSFGSLDCTGKYSARSPRPKVTWSQLAMSKILKAKLVRNQVWPWTKVPYEGFVWFFALKSSIVLDWAWETEVKGHLSHYSKHIMFTWIMPDTIYFKTKTIARINCCLRYLGGVSSWNQCDSVVYHMFIAFVVYQFIVCTKSWQLWLNYCRLSFE